MLWDRVNEFKPAQGLGDKFWEECFDYLSDIGWLKADYNTPTYIIDNIAINGEILDFDDIESDYDGDVEKWANNEGYLIFDDNVVINLGV